MGMQEEIDEHWKRGNKFIFKDEKTGRETELFYLPVIKVAKGSATCSCCKKKIRKGEICADGRQLYHIMSYEFWGYGNKYMCKTCLDDALSKLIEAISYIKELANSTAEQINMVRIL